MKTRKQYLNKDCTHAEYYAQFITEGVKRSVLQCFNLKELKASIDPSMNDLRLCRWDAVLTPFPKSVADKLREAGDFPTLAGGVCIAKQAARETVDG